METDNIYSADEVVAENLLEELSLNLQRDSRRYTTEIDYKEG